MSGAEFLYDIGYISGNILITERYRKLKFRTGRNPENEKRYKYTCLECGWIDGDVSESNLKRGTGCSSCAGTKVTPINCIWNKARWMVDLGVTEYDAKHNLPRSGKKITVKCPHCGEMKHITPNNLYTKRSISCQKCSDGIKYPEKFMMGVLNQLGVEYTSQLTKKDFKWCSNKKYDFYVPILNAIIETHGRQHYEEVKGFKRTLEEEQENDRIKKELALNNNISEYIVIDCRNSNMEWIRDSILNSELANIFDLSKIDWLECEKFALSNRIRVVADEWNNRAETDTTVTIAKRLNLARSTVNKYLSRANDLEWCTYNPKEERLKTCKNNIAGKNKRAIKVEKNGKVLGLFESTLELERKSIELFGEILYNSNISLTCQGKRKQYKGYHIEYIDNSSIAC